MSTKERFSAAKSRGLGRMRLCRLEQDVALLAKRQFYYAFGRETRGVEHHLLIADRDVVDPKTATLDLTARLAIRSDEAGPDKPGQHADAGLEFGTGNFDRRKVF